MPRKAKKPVSSQRRLLGLIAYLCARHPGYCRREDILEEVPGYKEGAGQKNATMLRMFERDKKELLGLGIPLEYSLLDENYRLKTDGMQIRRLALAPAEAAELRAFGQLVAGVKDFDYREELGYLLQKISIASAGLDESRGGYDSRLDVIFSMGDRPSMQRELHGKVVDAILLRKRLKMRYFTMWRGANTEREFDPFGLFFRNGQWYVVGWCHLRQRERVFRLSRIGLLAPALKQKKPPHFTIPKEFDLKRYTEREAWQLSREEAVEVEIRFSRDIAWIIKGNWSHVGKIRQLRDGSLVMKTMSNDKEAMVRWVLRFRESAELVGPPEYREHMKQNLREVIGRYE
jgi:proteasome accessory factor B